LVIREIQGLNELVSVKYTLQKVIALEEKKTPLGSEKILLFVQAEALGGIDLSKLTAGDVETLPLEHPDPGQLERLQAEHTSKEVRTGLAKLPDRARMALVLRYYADMSYDEIADTLGVRRAFVGVLLLRARHELRVALTEGGGENAQRASAGRKS
jgi:RNA polymerase sigma factor (sigma-70 family)